MADENVNILIADSHRDRLDEVVERAKAAGLRVDQVLREAAVISGAVDPARRKDLEQIEGVAAVELQREIQIPPPESDIQ